MACVKRRGSRKEMKDKQGCFETKCFPQRVSPTLESPAKIKILVFDAKNRGFFFKPKIELRLWKWHIIYVT